MPLTDSPSFEAEETLQAEAPPVGSREDSGGRFSQLRWIILVLAIVAGGLGLYVIFGPGYGTVMGSVRDIDGLPLEAEIFIPGMRQPIQTDSHGRFFVANVPNGGTVLTINYKGNSVFFQVEIPKWDSLNIGQIQIDTSA